LIWSDLICYCGVQGSAYKTQPIERPIVASHQPSLLTHSPVTRAVVTWYLKPWCLPGEVMTDMYYPIYAEGLYNSLMQVRVDGWMDGWMGGWVRRD